jgi:integrase/recombinase XerD
VRHGQIIDVNPAHAVPGPKHFVRKGKTPVLTAEEARTEIEFISREAFYYSLAILL